MSKPANKSINKSTESALGLAKSTVPSRVNLLLSHEQLLRVIDHAFGLRPIGDKVCDELTRRNAWELLKAQRYFFDQLLEEKAKK